jgi:hypothetical protein
LMKSRGLVFFRLVIPKQQSRCYHGFYGKQKDA